ncbi:Zn-dependent hydrolase [Afifella sp. IM 167]|uniref:Zn-dependent hydrolase n=1 Tax=Afifella sp. IM 167 TaxID=2033586 RepID=UPI001CCA8903|nr:Zn-dependent hydrolase [Afifella sp. IM 167]MBZ8133183.1 Zn-dependent hydrolase [Afifella sp. IM 167]
MPQETPRIDIERLKALLAGVNRFGRNLDTGGFNRVGYSPADMAARDWLRHEMEKDGLSARRDGAGNLFARFGPAEGPAILAGSHLDTVPEGGAFDGALGVCAALECVRAMKDAGIRPETAIEVVATAEEEGRFGGMLGSEAIVGHLTRERIEAAKDADGVPLVEAMREAGLDAFEALSALRPSREVKAFIELHIEQGPVLERAGRPIGIAHGVSGVLNRQVTLTGTANHSGTTPMEMRADAFAGLAEIATLIAAAIGEEGTPQSRITIGKVDLQPNAAHTIPGKAVFSLIIRDTSDEVMRALRAAMEARIAMVARKHGLGVSVEEKSWIAPVGLDPALNAMLHEEARKMGTAALDMPSGAGHDAQTMQALCPAALIFVPSRGGISHAPEEFSEWSDIGRGTELMLRALMRLSSR